MIPVDPAPEPSGFDENVRSKGRDWIARQGQRVITEFPSYWRWCEPQLHEAFRGRCGWAAMTITSGQIDHFVVSQAECKREQPERAYDWDNYRYIMPELNSKKGRRPAVLDPFEVQAGWFELALPHLHLRSTAAIPASLRELADATLPGLELERGDKLMRLRRKYMLQYRMGKTRIELLDDDFPLLADALRRLFAAQDEELGDELRHWRAELIAARQAANASVP